MPFLAWPGGQKPEGSAAAEPLEVPSVPPVPVAPVTPLVPVVPVVPLAPLAPAGAADVLPAAPDGAPDTEPEDDPAPEAEPDESGIAVLPPDDVAPVVPEVCELLDVPLAPLVSLDCAGEAGPVAAVPAWFRSPLAEPDADPIPE